MCRSERNNDYMDKDNIFSLMNEGLKKDEKRVLLTIVDGPEIGSNILYGKKGEVLSGTAPEGLDITKVPMKELFEWNGVQYFAQLAEKNPEILILGAGHVSRAIADILIYIGCDVTVVDDRVEYLKPEFYHEAVHRVTIDFNHLDILPLNHYMGIIIVTRAHEYDTICLRQLRPYLHTYIGMMGSTKRIYHVKLALAAEGWSDEELGSFYGPIGMDLGCDTPEEIGLSIVSEYLSVVRGKWPATPLKMRYEK